MTGVLAAREERGKTIPAPSWVASRSALKPEAIFFTLGSGPD
jgi:hypothetical protein